MKYPDQPAVDAVYTPNQLSGAQPNPFLEAMPEMLPKEALFRRLACSPPPPDAAQLKPSDRRRGLNALSSVFVPLDYMAVIYNTLFCAMESTYTASATVDSIRRVHAIHQGDGAALAQLPVATSTDSGSILGVPGIGKSSTIRRCLRQIPQVIRHSQYGDSKLYCNQVTWLMVECPGDCSVKTLALNIIEAIDRAIGSSYSELTQRVARLPSASVLATRVKIGMEWVLCVSVFGFSFFDRLVFCSSLIICIGFSDVGFPVVGFSNTGLPAVGFSNIGFSNSGGCGCS